jgi:hypothetical protein
MFVALIGFSAASVLPPMPVKTCTQKCCSDDGGGCPCDPTDGECGAECCTIDHPPVQLHWMLPIFSALAPVPADANTWNIQSLDREESPPLPPPRI